MRDNCYADDLVTICSSLKGLQARADVVVGFCLIFGVLLSTDKFRAFAVNWGEQAEAGKQYIQVCSPGASPTKVELKRDGVLKHLGVLWDMELSNGTQLCKANAELTRHLDRIVLRAGSMESK
jgi:hypothetical protein